MLSIRLGKALPLSITSSLNIYEQGWSLSEWTIKNPLAYYIVGINYGCTPLAQW
jgi:hypothetical protein